MAVYVLRNPLSGDLDEHRVLRSDRTLSVPHSILVRRSLQSFGVMSFPVSLSSVLSKSATTAMACFLAALCLALMISGAFFSLVTSAAFKRARQREVQAGTSRLGAFGTR